MRYNLNKIWLALKTGYYTIIMHLVFLKLIELLFGSEFTLYLLGYFVIASIFILFKIFRHWDRLEIRNVPIDYSMILFIIFLMVAITKWDLYYLTLTLVFFDVMISKMIYDVRIVKNEDYSGSNKQNV